MNVGDIMAGNVLLCPHCRGRFVKIAKSTIEKTGTVYVRFDCRDCPEPFKLEILNAPGQSMELPQQINIF